MAKRKIESETMIQTRKSKFYGILEDISVSVLAGIPILYIVSWEEERVIAELEAMASVDNRKLFIWTQTEGLINAALPNEQNQASRDPFNVLTDILTSTERGIYILLDFHAYLESRIVRRLRDAATRLRKHGQIKTIILLSPVLKIPPELEKDIKVFDFDLPTEAELKLAQQLIMTPQLQIGRMAPKAMAPSRAPWPLRLSSSRKRLDGRNSCTKPPTTRLAMTQKADSLKICQTVAMNCCHAAPMPVP